MKSLVLVLAVAAPLLAQDQHHQRTEAPAASPDTTAEQAREQEIHDLTTSLQEAGNSPNDYIRALEAHLAKYPNSSRRNEIERALAKAAIEAKDRNRTILYGERVLGRDSSDVQLLERVSRAYLESDDRQSAEKGLAWSKKYAAEIEKLRKEPSRGRVSAGQWSDDLDKAQSRAVVLESRGAGNLGDLPSAVALAGQSWAAYPTAEGAREWAKWLAKSGDLAGAVEHYAQAFVIEDPRSTEVDRAHDRMRMGELYVKANGSEKGLGDIVLRAYDQTSNLLSDRIARLKAADPNAQASKILDFTLPSVNGPPLVLSTLKGKTIVLDFWATWCGPCRVQRPLYEQVERKFKERSNVVFLSINTDEDRAGVAPFLKAQKWTQTVFFDGGLSEYAKVTSIPTTLIVGKDGQVSSRMNGFIPERFVDLLTQRINETLP